MSFTEQMEALCIDRQFHFKTALLEGKSIEPRRGQEWTMADLVFLQATLNVLMEGVPALTEDELRLPLSAIPGVFEE